MKSICVRKTFGRLAMLVLFAFMSQAAYGQLTTWRGGQLVFVATNDLNIPPYRGCATLSTRTNQCSNGGEVCLEMRFFNGGEGCRVYNPFFNTGTQAPARLAVYDAKGAYLGDLLKLLNIRAAQFGFNPERWAFTVPHEGEIGTVIHARVSGLSPGDYRLQLVFDKLFLFAPTSTPAVRGDENELFRSNPVTITVIK